MFWAPEPSATIATSAAATPAGRQKSPILLGSVQPIVSNVSSDTAAAAQHQAGRGSGLPIRYGYSPLDLRTRAAREKPSHLYDPASYCLERSAGPLTQLVQLVPQGVDLPLDLLERCAFRSDEHTPVLAAGVAQESDLDGRNSVWGSGLDIVQRPAIGA